MSTRVRRLGALVVIATLVSATAPLRAQGVQAGQPSNQELLNELKAIRQLLETLNARLTPPTAPAPAANRPVRLNEVKGLMLGKADAPLTMVEFTDLQCPFCRQFHSAAFEQIKRDYIDTGKLRYFSRDYPIPSLHPLAMAAAKASSCAADQDTFWEMRHLILAGNQQLRPESFGAFAQDLRLDMAKFTACANDPAAHSAQLAKDIADANSIGINGTPTFVVGRTAPTGLDGVLVVGAQPFAVFDAKFKELLSAVR